MEKLDKIYNKLEAIKTELLEEFIDELEEQDDFIEIIDSIENAINLLEDYCGID